MSTIRVNRRHRYTTIDRETVNDERLSFRARGILLWLLDKPDNWRCTAETIERAGTEGREAIRSAMRELRELGYVARTRHQDERGHWSTEVTVHERPTADEPETGEPSDGNPLVGEPGVSMKTDTEDCERRETSSLAVAVVEPMTLAPTKPEREAVYNALAVGCGFDLSEMSKDAKRVTALAANDLIDMGVFNPDEIQQRCMAYRLKFSGAACTPKAVVKHWPGLRPELVEAEQQHKSRMASPQKESAADRIARIRNERNAR